MKLPKLVCDAVYGIVAICAIIYGAIRACVDLIK